MQPLEVKLYDLELPDPVRLGTEALSHKLSVTPSPQEQFGPFGRQRGCGEADWEAADVYWCPTALAPPYS